jgi:hypothetical protein
LKLVTFVDCFKAVEELIEPHSTLICFEAIANQKMNEDNLSLRPDAVYLSTDIVSDSRSDILCGCMRDHLFSGRICTHMLVSLTISSVCSMDTNFIVVALGVESKPANKCSYFVIL